jgi:hypothetical protein
VPKRKNNAKWITPIIFSAIIGLCVFLCAFAIYEFLIIQIKKCRKLLAILIAVLAFILMGFVVVVIYKVTGENPTVTVETKSMGWQPPELPPGCSNVTVFFGKLRVDEPRWMAEIEHDESEPSDNETNTFTEHISSNLTLTVYDSKGDTNESGTTFLVKDLPSSFGVDMEKMSDYSPRKRHITMRVFSGKNLNNPVLPFVSSNRLFVDVLIPFINERYRIFMDTNLDFALTNLPDKWDINYNSNRFEIVNEDTNPVLQVIYKSPSEVHVNGIYIVDGYSIFEAFDTLPNTISPQMVFGNLQSTQQFITPLENFAKIFKNVTITMNTNSIFRTKYLNQKAFFQYPSWEYLGELAK